MRRSRVVQVVASYLTARRSGSVTVVKVIAIRSGCRQARCMHAPLPHAPHVACTRLFPMPHSPHVACRRPLPQHARTHSSSVHRQTNRRGADWTTRRSHATPMSIFMHLCQPPYAPRFATTSCVAVLSPQEAPPHQEVQASYALAIAHQPFTHCMT